MGEPDNDAFELLNARKRRCRVHSRSAPSGLTARGPAQRSKASLSGSPPAAAWAMPGALAAQRSKASLSGSPPGSAQAPAQAKPAQRSKASLSGSQQGAQVARHGVEPAQRSKASLSGSPVRLPQGRGRRQLLNARKRRCRVHNHKRIETRSWPTAQRSKASLSGSPKLGDRGRGLGQLLNARKRRCRVHGVESVRVARFGICSTLESVVVGFTSKANPRRRLSRTAQRSKASLSGSPLWRRLPLVARCAAQRSKASLSGSRRSGSSCPRG